MPVRIINQAETARLLPMPECIEVVAGAFEVLARGQATQPLRPVLPLSEDSVLVLMPAHHHGIGAAGAKVFTVFPGNHGTEYEAHQGVVLLFETEHGTLRAIIDATAITAIRTAAASAVATRLLARADADDLAILGTGTQARTHLEAMRLVGPIRRVRVWSRSEENRRAFATRETQKHGLLVEAMPTVRETVAGAHLICTATSASEPILKGEWLSPGAHINAVGASIADVRELDATAVARSRLLVSLCFGVTLLVPACPV